MRVFSEPNKGHACTRHGIFAGDVRISADGIGVGDGLAIENIDMQGQLVAWMRCQPSSGASLVTDISSEKM